MKLRDYVNPEAVRNDDSIIPMFGIDRERWDELSDAVTAFFDAGGKISETFERFDDYMELKDEKELIAIMYMFGVEKGRFEGEELSMEHGLEPIRHGRISRVERSAKWLKERGIPFTEYLQRFLDKLKSHRKEPEIHVSTGRGLESLIATILRDVIGNRENDVRSQFSNKNKFKKGDFDIPDPNEPTKES